MEKAMEVSGMTKLYSNGRGIKNIDLSINQGDVLGILGPNGAGKTTLLKCMTGQVKPDSGKVELFGIDIEKNFKQAIRPVGAVVGQGIAYENMTPYQNLKMVLRFYPHLPSSSIDEVLELTGLYSYKYEKISSFSTGMKQRFGIASALISKPRLVILDEPTNGLDIDGLLLFRNTIQQLANNTGVTFVISSHHISEMEKLCNRFCFLIGGKISLTDTSHQSLEETYVKKIGEASYESSAS
ncbi:ABC transporter ATP-binding protein [Bacillus sp. 1NLA3E]|uniref:ABC transporter ATP-binding protein n=1 Tax=Bacillus sp. 1NLA3E TaxID=666686 RepID=UPI000247E7CE|nr:ABC transporter ATP-binding protein [Bacillus sp. 1NLA3E]AGK52202.1 ABC transporter [Bacillus sp. 1NLA3E]